MKIRFCHKTECNPDLQACQQMSICQWHTMINYAISPKDHSLWQTVMSIDGRCSVIDWVADILCQIIDRNFTRCHWQFLQIGISLSLNVFWKVNLLFLAVVSLQWTLKCIRMYNKLKQGVWTFEMTVFHLISNACTWEFYIFQILRHIFKWLTMLLGS